MKLGPPYVVLIAKIGGAQSIEDFGSISLVGVSTS